MPKIDEFIRINEPRAKRAREQINHVIKSANSMKVDMAEVGHLLSQEGLSYVGMLTRATESADEGPLEVSEGDTTGKHWNGLIQAVHEAPLKDLMDAMMVIATRVQEEIDQ